MMKTKLLLLAGMMMITCFSCTKTGPDGPQGVPGEQGAKGDKGNNGDKGDPGTANVIYSGWNHSFTEYSGEWNVPALTAEILNTGTVLIYVRFDPFLVGPYSYGQLPYSDGPNREIRASYQPGVITIRSVTLKLTFLALRYVIIPGSIAGRRAAGVDYSNYLEVCKYYHIEP